MIEYRLRYIALILVYNVFNYINNFDVSLAQCQTVLALAASL